MSQDNSFDSVVEQHPKRSSVARIIKRFGIAEDSPMTGMTTDEIIDEVVNETSQDVINVSDNNCIEEDIIGGSTDELIDTDDEIVVHDDACSSTEELIEVRSMLCQVIEMVRDLITDDDGEIESKYVDYDRQLNDIYEQNRQRIEVLRQYN